MPKVAKFCNVGAIQISTRRTKTGTAAVIRFKTDLKPQSELFRLIDRQDEPLNVIFETPQLKAFGEPIPDKSGDA